MRKLLLAFLLFPLLCSAQRYRNDVLAVSEDTIKASYWQVLERAGERHPMTTFFRIVNTSDNYTLELKLMLGDTPFIVAEGAKMDLEFDNRESITLLNRDYTKSCKGCGARKFEGNDVHGATLTFAISRQNMDELMHNYLAHIKLHLDDDSPGARISDSRSEDFMDAVWLVYRASQYKSNSIY